MNSKEQHCTKFIGAFGQTGGKWPEKLFLLSWRFSKDERFANPCGTRPDN